MANVSIRESYGESLVELGRVNHDVVVLEADVSHSTRTVHFARAFPDRFFNFGIAEGNMMSAAAGLAATGKIPFANTFAFLAALRAGDPVRSLIAYNALNVKIVGSYAGLSDAKDGASHQSICDLAVMRSLPNLTVIIPADAAQTRQAVHAAARFKGPVYLRLSRAELPVIYSDRHPFEIGRAEVLKPGTDVTVIACGYMVHKGREAASMLERNSISAELIAMPTIKPIDRECLLNSVEKTRAVVTVEEHSVVGGLGSAVAEVLSEILPVPVIKVGIDDRFAESGEYESLLDKYGLSATHIVEAADRAISLRRKRG